jgi:hypothetical protein
MRFATTKAALRTAITLASSTPVVTRAGTGSVSTDRATATATTASRPKATAPRIDGTSSRMANDRRRR